jgi:hypothetical protein
MYSAAFQLAGNSAGEHRFETASLLPNPKQNPKQQNKYVLGRDLYQNVKSA